MEGGSELMSKKEILPFPKGSEIQSLVHTIIINDDDLDIELEVETITKNAWRKIIRIRKNQAGPTKWVCLECGKEFAKGPNVCPYCGCEEIMQKEIKGPMNNEDMEKIASRKEKVFWCFLCGWIAPKGCAAEDLKFCTKCLCKSLILISKYSILEVQDK